MILGIESSCDESALALLDPNRGILGEWISSQVSLHAEYGGVVPDLASREHLGNFGPLLKEASLQQDLSLVEKIVVTSGPGLAGCLAMGLAVANALSAAWNVPVYAANHLRAHAHSVFLPLFEGSPQSFDTNLSESLPHLSLIVSGGNTILARIDEDRSLTLIGQTVDDAAGEALDKGAKLLGLGYPGGPKLERIASGGDAACFDFPRALLNKASLDFSFSGLKTSLRYTLDKMSEDEVAKTLPDLCASYQEAVIDVLIRKTAKAMGEHPYRSLGLSGGVSNNSILRNRFETLATESKVSCFLANRQHTGDNAGMIAFSHLFEGKDGATERIDIRPGLTIEAIA